jgi:hypothetical protein
MKNLERRIELVAGPLAVALWIVGLIVGQALPSKLPSDPTDPQILAWVQGNKNTIILGGFLFILGCVVFLWFAALLRSRLAAAEGDAPTFASLVFGAAVAMTALGAATQGDLATAINADDVSAATAGTLHHVGDLFFVGAEVCLSAFLVGTALVAFRTRILPRWWAALSVLVGVVALIGPIGWASLVWGLPVWMLGTTLFLVRAPRARRARAAAVGAA